jgi:hypothetical protein
MPAARQRNTGPTLAHAHTLVKIITNFGTIPVQHTRSFVYNITSLKVYANLVRDV